MADIGRKVQAPMDCPVDNGIIVIVKSLSPLLHALHITPNMLTTVSLVLSVWGVYHINIGNYRYGGILTFIGYIFDCWDGYMARKYDMGTVFGDWYDHLSDIFKMLLLIFIVLNYTPIKYKTKVAFVIVLIVFMMLSNAYLGCLEHYAKIESVLSPLKMLCPDKSYIKYFRYTGTGFFFLVLSLFIYNMSAIDKLL
jgi:phosphatidylglycerophosphate synthase